MKHRGSGRGFCERLGCHEYTTKIVGRYCLCDKHADEFIFTGAGRDSESLTVVDVKELRDEAEGK